MPLMPRKDCRLVFVRGTEAGKTRAGHYLKRHDLPYHPLWDQGYVSIGDVHSTRPLGPGMREEDTRFFGIKRECGIHFDEQRESA